MCNEHHANLFLTQSTLLKLHPNLSDQVPSLPGELSVGMHSACFLDWVYAAYRYTNILIIMINYCKRIISTVSTCTTVCACM